jgi:hypothetical protein
MSNTLPVTVGVLVLALIGALASLVVLIPPIRKLGRRSRIARAAEVVVIGVVSFAISFGLFTRLGAEVAYIFSTIGTPPWQEVYDPLRPAIVEELWMRELVPPPWRQPCYTSDTVVCQRADWATPGGEASGSWGAYLRGIGIYLVSSLAGGSLSWVFTRKRPRDAQ